MKAEHRKELKTNVLAETLEKTLQSIKEGPSRGTLLTLGVVALALVLFFTWRYFATSAREDDSSRWLRWDSLIAAQQLEAFAQDKDIQGTPQGRLARFQVARLDLFEGLRQLGSSRNQGVESITRAAQAYVKLVDDTQDVPLLQQEALMGAAKAYESLGDLKKAQTYYDRLTREHPQSALGQAAAKDLQRLTDEANNKDLKDLAKEFSPPPARPVPEGPGLEPGRRGAAASCCCLRPTAQLL